MSIKVYFLPTVLGLIGATSGFFCGAQTNKTDCPGISASAKYFPFWPDGGPVVRVYLHFQEPNTNIPYKSPFPSAPASTNDTLGSSTSAGIFFMATNSFSGFVALRNELGQEIEILKPEVNLPISYPASYGLTTTRQLLSRKGVIEPARPGCLSGSDPEQYCFRLQDYFKIEKPGDYQLTICPIIYKRSETNADIVHRIDIPPVTIPIHWTGEVKN